MLLDEGFGFQVEGGVAGAADTKQEVQASSPRMIARECMFANLQ